MNISHWESPSDAKNHASDHLVTIERPVRFDEPVVSLQGAQTLKVYIDPTYSDEQTKVIREAIDYFAARSSHYHVFDRAVSDATKDLPPERPGAGSNATQRRRYHSAWHWFTLTGSSFRSSGLPFPLFGNKATLYISRVWDEGGVIGKGWQDIVDDNDDPAEFIIALNSDYIDEEYHLGLDPEYWSGVIAHECLHNVGHNHPNGYDGSFINEFGNQVWSNGSGTLSLVDPTGARRPMPSTTCGR